MQPVGVILVDPPNQVIFEALIRLATELSEAEIIRGANAAGWSHPAISGTSDSTNDLRIAFDNENAKDEQKARRSLSLLTEQWVVDVGNKRVQAALGDSGLEFVDNEFRWLEHRAGTARLEIPSVTMEAGRKPSPDKVYHGTVSQAVELDDSADVVAIRGNRLAGPDVVPVEKVQTEHATSLASLERLRDTLDGLHGSDATGEPAERNTQECPLTEAELSDLRTIVNAAIELHQVRSFSKQVADAHQAVLNVLERMNEIIRKLAETAEALGDLGKNIGYAVQSWAALIAAVVAYFL